MNKSNTQAKAQPQQESRKESQAEIIRLLIEIRGQNDRQLAKIEAQSQQIEQLEKTATKRGAVAGAVAGGVTGSVMALGIEFIKAKLGL